MIINQAGLAAHTLSPTSYRWFRYCPAAHPASTRPRAAVPLPGRISLQITPLFQGEAHRVAVQASADIFPHCFPAVGPSTQLIKRVVDRIEIPRPFFIAGKDAWMSQDELFQRLPVLHPCGRQQGNPAGRPIRVLEPNSFQFVGCGGLELPKLLALLLPRRLAWHSPGSRATRLQGSL